MLLDIKNGISGDTLCQINVHLLTTVWDVKRCIQRKTGIPVGEQILCCPTRYVVLSPDIRPVQDLIGNAASHVPVLRRLEAEPVVPVAPQHERLQTAIEHQIRILSTPGIGIHEADAALLRGYACVWNSLWLLMRRVTTASGMQTVASLIFNATYYIVLAALLGERAWRLNQALQSLFSTCSYMVQYALYSIGFYTTYVAVWLCVTIVLCMGTGLGLFGLYLSAVKGLALMGSFFPRLFAR